MAIVWLSSGIFGIHILAYYVGAVAAGLGGLLYIVGRDTIDGAVMGAGFGLYGAFMAIAAIQTVRFAMAGALSQHRAWAIRLFALTIGSWLYRIDYGFWGLLAGRLGRTKTFDGQFDMVMVFWFFVPNLRIAENCYLRPTIRLGTGIEARRHSLREPRICVPHAGDVHGDDESMGSDDFVAPGLDQRLNYRGTGAVR